MQQFIKEIFQALGCFDFAAANKFLNRSPKSNFNVVPIFTILIKCEQSYTSLEYLKTKLFRKEDYLNTLYTEAINLVKNLSKLPPPTSVNNGDQLDVELLVDLCNTLQDFIQTRQSQIKISIITHFSNINAEEIVREIERVRNKTEEHRLSEKLGPLGVGVENELTILKYLFVARKAIVTFNFKNSTVFLYTARSKLSSWKEVCSQQVYPEKSSNRNEESTSAFSAFQSFFSSNSDKQLKNVKRGNISPNNMQWLGKFLSNLTARMTLYFMNVLLEKETVLGGDLKSLWKKIEVDHHDAIRNFRRKFGTSSSIALIYEVSNDVPFYPLGYVCDGVQYEKPTGLKSFPCIYCYPKDQPPENHMPNIISIMQDKDPKKITPFVRTAPIHFFDKKVGSAYYFVRIDDFVSLVVIFSEKHSVADSSTSEAIMTLANSLSGVDILTSLRD
ncbi:8511_t:CDS:2 [Funneliformis caledonium]|uniref:8511_t:CDS:1 n=1 Tax=Funneliformis caledonium TaxID=1117310 RepID=A0A9N9FEG8_9GLOM|nr:8511_t:CDS:2 [Funneliformis caledonium]